jgi:hypothetical protein
MAQMGGGPLLSSLRPLLRSIFSDPFAVGTTGARKIHWALISLLSLPKEE